MNEVARIYTMNSLYYQTKKSLGDENGKQTIFNYNKLCVPRNQ